MAMVVILQPRSSFQTTRALQVVARDESNTRATPKDISAVFQQTSISEGSPLFGYLSSLEDGFCPYLSSAWESQNLFFSQYDLRDADPTAIQARLLFLGLIHTEWARFKRRMARSTEHSLLICENLILEVDSDIGGPQIFAWPHFVLKALYTEAGLLFGKFWIGEKDCSSDGRKIPEPPIHLLSIRSAIKKKDHRFFKRVMEGMLPEFERSKESDVSPLHRVDWIPRELTDKILNLVASDPHYEEIISLTNTLMTENIYPSAKSWAEERLKEIKMIEGATKSARILGQLLPRLAEHAKAPLTCMQQITNRRGVAVWRVDTDGAGSFALKYITHGDAGPHDPAALVRREGIVLKEVGRAAGDILVDNGEIDSVPFLVTKWQQEAVSSDKIAKQLLLNGSDSDIEQLVLMIEGMVESIEIVHEAGWVHGDVQPAHFMVDSQTRVQLLDWALARREDRSDGFSHGGCLVHYAAPEVASSMLQGLAETGYNRPAEIYALSATLMFLLTGEVAVDYGPDEPEEMGPRRLKYRLGRVASGKYIRTLGGRWANTALAKAIQAGLQPDPSDRPTAGAILHMMRGE